MLQKSNLLKYAVDYLSKYNSTKKNLERILKLKIIRISKNNPENRKLFSQIPEVIEKLEKNNLINDKDFTRNKIYSFADQGKSKIFIFNYLIKKGVNKDIIENEFVDFHSSNSEWEKKSALVFARKNKLFDKTKEVQKKLGKMSRAGFSYELSKEILEID